ncbi:MAG: hypothetical protein M3540_10490 [Actinomycetota bacterium]|nr:hypothetical protein [Actinomycetota bacterium]
MSIVLYAASADGITEVTEASQPTPQAPLWVDVPAGAQAVAAELLAACEALVPDGALDELCSPADPPSPAQGALWAFGATLAEDDDESFSIDLQPVRLVVCDAVIVTHRLPGTRFSIDPHGGESVGDAVGLPALLEAANRIWADRGRDDPGDRDLLLFAILGGLVSCHFVARAELAQRKTRIDLDFFGDLARSRELAARLDPTAQQVREVALEGAWIVERARHRLNAVQATVVCFREWYDRLKPPGRADRAIWLVRTTREDDAAELVRRIYQVRNDLGTLRRDVHASMALLASADTGGQLLAVRALLDRTEWARRAGIVAGAVTLVLASAGLVAAVAAIPQRSVRYPVAQAAAAAGFLVVSSIVFGVLISFATGSRARRWPSWLIPPVAAIAATGSLLMWALAFVGEGSRAPWLIAAGGLIGIALLLVALSSDFGARGRRRAEVDATRRLMANRREWRGTPHALHAALTAAARRRDRWSGWPKDAETTLARLREDIRVLNASGIELRERHGEIELTGPTP